MLKNEHTESTVEKKSRAIYDTHIHKTIANLIAVIVLEHILCVRMCAFRSTHLVNMWCVLFWINGSFGGNCVNKLISYFFLLPHRNPKIHNGKLVF